ncbi:hypothetical protein [Mastigocoleus testarum]|nr:hypothetical protein [Mastigocoleus testarum]
MKDKLMKGGLFSLCVFYLYPGLEQIHIPYGIKQSLFLLLLSSIGMFLSGNFIEGEAKLLFQNKSFLTIALTIGSSGPEIMTCIISGLKNESHIGLGMVIGSASVNAAYAFTMLIIAWNVLRKKDEKLFIDPSQQSVQSRLYLCLFMLGLALTTFLTLFAIEKNNWLIFLLITISELFLVYRIYNWSSLPPINKYGDDALLDEDDENMNQSLRYFSPQWFFSLTIFCTAFVLLILSSESMVENLKFFAIAIKVPEFLVSYILGAFGSSVPEFILGWIIVREAITNIQEFPKKGSAQLRIAIYGIFVLSFGSNAVDLSAALAVQTISTTIQTFSSTIIMNVDIILGCVVASILTIIAAVVLSIPKKEKLIVVLSSSAVSLYIISSFFSFF